MIKMHHVAIEVEDAQGAEKFFVELCGLKRAYDFKIDSRLAEQIFGVPREIEVINFINEEMRIEVFVTGEKPVRSFSHICLLVADKKEFSEKCIKLGFEANIIERNGKNLLFVRDYSGNLFEIKEVEKR